MKNKTNRRTAWLLPVCLILVLMSACAAPVTGLAAEDVPVIIEDVLRQEQTQPDVQTEPVVEQPAPDTNALPEPIDVPAIAETTPVPTYRVTFYDMYGNVYAWADVPQGNYIIEPEEPIMPGYDFHYWYDEMSELLEPYPFGEPVTREINLWPMLTVALPAINPESILAGQGEGGDSNALDTAKTADELVQEIIRSGEEAAGTQPADGPSETPSLAEEILRSGDGQAAAAPTPDDVTTIAQNLAEEILQTQQPDLETPSSITAEGILATVTEEPILAPEVTNQPLDARAIIAEIIGMKPEDIGESEPVAAPSDAPADQTEQGDTAVADKDVTIQMIEAIMETPVPSANVTPVIEQVEAAPSGEPIVTGSEPPSLESILPENSPEPETTSEETVAAKQSPDTVSAGETPGIVEITDVIATSEPEEVVAEETQAPDGAMLPDEALLPDDEQQETEEAAEPGDVAANATISISSRSDDEVVGYGSTITLLSGLDGIPEGAMVVYQWQNDASGQYEDVPGATGSTYTFVLDSENSNWDWRLQVQIITL